MDFDENRYGSNNEYYLEMLGRSISGSLFDRKDQRNNEIQLFKNFKTKVIKTVFETATKPKASSSSSQPKLRKTEEDPLLKILFKDLNLRELESNLGNSPFLKYLKNMQKGGNASKSLFSVFAAASEKLEVEFSKSFRKKISLIFGNPSILIKLKVIKPPEATRFNDDWDCQCLIQRYLSNERKLKDIHSDNIELLPSGEPTFSDWENNCKSEELVFVWTVTIKYEKASAQGIKLKQDGHEILKSLYEMDDVHKDLTIIVANGAGIKCHKNILMAQSAPLLAMLSRENGMIEGETGRVEMKKNSAEGIEKFVEFLYGFEILDISADLGVELLQLANKYEVKKLEELMIEFILEKEMKWFTPDSILEVYFLTRNVLVLEEMRDHALAEMSTIPEWKLKACEYYRKLKPGHREELLFRLLEWNKN